MSVADLTRAYQSARVARLSLEKVAEAQKKIETAAKSELVDALYAHVKATGEFDLLYKRLNASAVNQRWEDGKVVPGTQPFPVEELSIRKAK